jgi:hypothetical protein
MNHQENNQCRGIPSAVLGNDLRREDPLLQGFKGSGGGSNGSGGIPNPHLQSQESEKEVLSSVSYRNTKPKNEERNALSQD